MQINYKKNIWFIINTIFHTEKSTKAFHSFHYIILLCEVLLKEKFQEENNL